MTKPRSRQYEQHHVLKFCTPLFVLCVLFGIMGITIYSKSYQNLLSILHSCTETAVTAQEKFEIFNVAVAVTLNFGGLLEARENNSACKHFHFAPKRKVYK